MDSDHDGLTNAEEYLAGTDPLDPLSFLKVERIAATGVTEIQFSAVSNHTYTVQYTDALKRAPWFRLADYPAAPTNRVEAALDPVPKTQRYYRLATPRVK